MRHFLPSLTTEEEVAFKNHLSAHSAPIGTILTELGSRDRDLYLLETGACEVYQKFTLCKELFALRVGKLKAPVIFGEANMLFGEQRNATIIVSEPLLVYYKLSYADFFRLKENHKDIAIKLLEQLSMMVSRRFMDMQRNLMNRFLAEEPQPAMGLRYLQRFMGNVTPCSPDLAEKLFHIQQPPLEHMQLPEDEDLDAPPPEEDTP